MFLIAAYTYYIYMQYINVISSKCNRKAVPVNAPSLKPEHAS